MEVWKQVIGYEGLYEVSNLGRIRSVERMAPSKGGSQRRVPEKMLTPARHWTGYMHVGLCKDGRMKSHLIHRLVLEAFRGEAPDDTEARHGDGDRSNNALDNLEWGTRVENADDKVGHGTAPIGDKNPRAKLTEAQVLEIFRRGWAGEEGKSLASAFGVSNQTVSHIIRGRTWSHVTGATHRGF